MYATYEKFFKKAIAVKHCTFLQDTSVTVHAEGR